MRYKKDHKQQTHQKIIEVAAGNFRTQGFEGVSIGRLMSNLDLTHGGFYRHFSNKEELYTEALAYSVEEVQARLLERVTNPESPSLKEVIVTYLSEEHCDAIGQGCPVAALSTDVSRQSAEIRSSFDGCLQKYMQRFLLLMPGETQENKTKRFLVLFSGMAGALSVARAVSDPAMRQAILESAREFYINTFCE
ncbi:MAG: TetR/AcrR family transcriptional regulator [Chloroflexota bacterium]